MMKTDIKLLILEDAPEDVLLIKSYLKKLKRKFSTKVVDNEEDFTNSLEKFSPDIVLADHNLPAFNSMKALEIIQKRHKKIPLILISGVVSQEFAISCIQKGVFDYIMKDRMERLPSAVQNALENNALENERDNSINEIIASQVLFKRAEKVGRFGVWESDLINNTTKWSDETFRILGYEPGEIEPSSENFLKCIHRDDIKEAHRIIDETIKDKDTAKLSFRIICKAGTVKYVESEFLVERNEKNEPVRITGFNKDITQQKKSDEKIARNEKKFTALVENADDIISLTDAEGKITYVSPALQKVTGFSPEEVIGKSFFFIMHPEQAEESKKVFADLLKNPGIPFSRTNRFQHKDGSYRWIEGIVINLLNDENVNAIVSNHRDITERKDSEIKLEKANRLYSFLSHINQTIVHAKDENTLLEDACRVAVEFGKFKMAWIGFTDIGDGKIRLAAQFGATEKNIEVLKDYIYDVTGPIAKVVNGADYCEVNDVLKKSKLAWETIGKEQSLNSAISLPIKQSGKITGTFNLYFSEINFFDETEIQLLKEVATDISFALDVFEQKKLKQKAEHKIIEDEKKYHDLFERNPMPMFVLDPISFKFLDVNNEAVKNYGYTKEEFLTLTALEIRPEEDREKFVKIDRTSNTHIHHAGDWRHIRKDGRLIYVEIKVDEIIYNGVKARLVLANDITERVTMEKKVEQSESNLKAAQAIAHVGSWEVDFAKGISIWSDECCRIYGLFPEDNIQSLDSWLSFVHPEDVEFVMKTIKKAEVLKVSTSFYHRIKRRDGSIRYLYSQPIFKMNAEGIPTGVYGVVHDVTESRIAEEEKTKLTEDIFRRNKELEQFAYIISHNLRAPVANIIGFAEELSIDTYNEEEKSLFLMELLSAVRRLDEIILDLNDILHSKQEISERREEVFLAQLVYFIKTSIINLMDKERVEIITDFKDVKVINTIKSYLHSVFHNLIINSIKYKHPDRHPVIQIIAKRLNGKILLTFKDNGMGIDLTKKGDQVFGLYKRFNTTVEGRGMGLFMVKSHIESLGGQIIIKSIPGTGTEFEIELPDIKIE